ncbi:MAG: thrombospondin type 3 repeat-containing protein [Lysobacterales bacterium]
MKTLLLVLSVAGLSGCAVYPAPAYESYGPGPPYVVEQQPVYIQGGGVYRYGGYPYAYPRGYNRFHPGVFSHQPPIVHAPRPHPGARDQDRDGIPNRLDRDRDGDGVPNRWDRQPNDPRVR